MKAGVHPVLSLGPWQHNNMGTWQRTIARAEAKTLLVGLCTTDTIPVHPAWQPRVVETAQLAMWLHMDLRVTLLVTQSGEIETDAPNALAPSVRR